MVGRASCKACCRVCAVVQKVKSDVKLEKNGTVVPGKSIIGIMSLGIAKGEEVKIIVEGDDEGEALNVIKELLNKE